MTCLYLFSKNAIFAEMFEKRCPKMAKTGKKCTNYEKKSVNICKFDFIFVTLRVKCVFSQ